jgi:hypothetical protein
MFCRHRHSRKANFKQVIFWLFLICTGSTSQCNRLQWNTEPRTSKLWTIKRPKKQIPGFFAKIHIQYNVCDSNFGPTYSRRFGQNNGFKMVRGLKFHCRYRFKSLSHCTWSIGSDSLAYLLHLPIIHLRSFMDRFKIFTCFSVYGDCPSYEHVIMRIPVKFFGWQK